MNFMGNAPLKPTTKSSFQLLLKRTATFSSLFALKLSTVNEISRSAYKSPIFVLINLRRVSNGCVCELRERNHEENFNRERRKMLWC